MQLRSVTQCQITVGTGYRLTLLEFGKRLLPIFPCQIQILYLIVSPAVLVGIGGFQCKVLR